MASKKIVVKTSFQEDIRRFTVAHGTSLEELRAVLQKLYPALGDAFVVKYADDEGDMVSITSTEELSEALRFAETQTPQILRLTFTTALQATVTVPTAVVPDTVNTAAPKVEMPTLYQLPPLQPQPHSAPMMVPQYPPVAPFVNMHKTNPSIVPKGFGSPADLTALAAATPTPSQAPPVARPVPILVPVPVPVPVAVSMVPAKAFAAPRTVSSSATAAAQTTTQTCSALSRATAAQCADLSTGVGADCRELCTKTAADCCNTSDSLMRDVLATSTPASATSAALVLLSESTGESCQRLAESVSRGVGDLCTATVAASSVRDLPQEAKLTALRKATVDQCQALCQETLAAVDATMGIARKDLHHYATTTTTGSGDAASAVPCVPETLPAACEQLFRETVATCRELSTTLSASFAELSSQLTKELLKL